MNTVHTFLLFYAPYILKAAAAGCTSSVPGRWSDFSLASASGESQACLIFHKTYNKILSGVKIDTAWSCTTMYVFVDRRLITHKDNFTSIHACYMPHLIPPPLFYLPSSICCSAGDMEVCLLWVLCVVMQGSQQRADHLSRGVLPIVTRRCVVYTNLKREEPWPALGSSTTERWRKRSSSSCWHYSAWMHGFSPPPRCQWDLRSSGILLTLN